MGNFRSTVKGRLKRLFQKKEKSRVYSQQVGAVNPKLREGTGKRSKKSSGIPDHLHSEGEKDIEKRTQGGEGGKGKKTHRSIRINQLESRGGGTLQLMPHKGQVWGREEVQAEKEKRRTRKKSRDIRDLYTYLGENVIREEGGGEAREKKTGRRREAATSGEKNQVL